jgi:hypothetical protein
VKTSKTASNPTPLKENTMDPKLAEIYGTNQVSEADVEKLAAAELATKLAGDESATQEQADMSDEDLEAIAQKVLAAPAEQETEQETQGDPDGEAQEKIAEADYLGRVMAHAYVNELKQIEKTSGWGDMPQKMLGSGGKSGAARRAAGKVMGRVRDIAKNHTGKAVGGAAAASGAAGFAAGRASKKGKEKKSGAENQMSALDTLTLMRANEILEASGIDPNSLTKVEEPAQEQEKTSAPADERQVLANAVEERAWALLAQYGVEPAPAEQEQAE